MRRCYRVSGQPKVFWFSSGCEAPTSGTVRSALSVHSTGPSLCWYRNDLKNSRAGSSSCGPLNQAWRAAFTSSRSCSSACTVFFDCMVVTLQQPPDGRRRKGVTLLDQTCVHLDLCQITFLINPGQYLRCMHLNTMTVAIATHCFRFRIAGRTITMMPANGRGDDNVEFVRRRPARKPAVDSACNT